MWSGFCCLNMKIDIMEIKQVEISEIGADLVWKYNILVIFWSLPITLLHAKEIWNSSIFNWVLLSLRRIDLGQFVWSNIK